MASGELAVDPSNDTTGLLDLVTRNWKRNLATNGGPAVSRHSLAGKTGTLLGHISQKARLNSATCKAGTPVIVGGGDVTD